MSICKWFRKGIDDMKQEPKVAEYTKPPYWSGGYAQYIIDEDTTCEEIVRDLRNAPEASLVMSYILAKRIVEMQSEIDELRNTLKKINNNF